SGEPRLVQHSLLPPLHAHLRHPGPVHRQNRQVRRPLLLRASSSHSRLLTPALLAVVCVHVRVLCAVVRVRALMCRLKHKVMRYHDRVERMQDEIEAGGQELKESVREQLRLNEFSTLLQERLAELEREVKRTRFAS